MRSRLTGFTAGVAASLVTVFLWPSDAGAQTGDSSEVISSGKAFALSLLVPGLGHRYAHGGDWDGWASVFAAADAGLWAGLLGVEWRRDHLIDSYRTMAVKHAGVEAEGKDRAFYLNVATYPSSDAYTDAQLRNRTWSQVGYAAAPSYQWAWDTEANFLHFRKLREDAESLRRSRSVLITSLVANRLIAGFTALRAAGRSGEADLRLTLDPPPAGAAAPLVRVNYSF